VDAMLAFFLYECPSSDPITGRSGCMGARLGRAGQMSLPVTPRRCRNGPRGGGLGPASYNPKIRSSQDALSQAVFAASL
jgi:hypothetical protein